MFVEILFDGVLNCGEKSKKFFVMERIPANFVRIRPKEDLIKSSVWEKIAALVLSDCNLTHGDLLFDHTYRNMLINRQTNDIKIFDFDGSHTGLSTSDAMDVYEHPLSEVQIALTNLYESQNAPSTLRHQHAENKRIRQKYKLPNGEFVQTEIQIQQGCVLM